MPRMRVLVVEDEEDILDLIKYNLAKEGYEVTGVTSGERGLLEAKKRPPDLLILDLMLPGIDGMEVCRALKNDPKTAAIPVLMLTAKSEESDIVAGLELGADDYITKPFSPKVLISRVRTAIRRRTAAAVNRDETSVIRVHEIELHPGRHECRVKNKAVALTLTEFRILHFLARNAGWVFERDRIVEEVQGPDYPVTLRAVDVQIVGLRRKLGAAGKHIETVRGIGYRFRD